MYQLLHQVHVHIYKYIMIMLVGPVESSSHTGPSSPTQMDPFYSQG